MTSAKKQDRNYRLSELKLEVTYRCPLRCVHCSSEAGPDVTKEMSLSDALRIVDEAADMGVQKLAVSGGEAIIWEGILPLLEAGGRTGMELSLYTSGVDDRFSGVVSLLEDIGDSRVILSLYSYRPKVHDTVTLCQGSHAMTVEAIQEAVRAGVHTELHFTAMRENYGDLIGLCKLAAELGVQRVSVLRLVPQGRSDVNTSDIFLSHEDNMHLRELIKEGRSVVNLRVGSPYGFLHISDSPQCSAGVDRLIVLPDLTISPCDAFKQISSVNMTGTDEFSRLDRWCLSECWEKSPYLQAVRDHLREVHAVPCCVCANLAECFSGCTAQRYIANGRLVRGPDPECIVDGSGARGRGIR